MDFEHSTNVVRLVELHKELSSNTFDLLLLHWKTAIYSTNNCRTRKHSL